MDEGALIAVVGPRIDSAPILGGLRRRKDTGRRVHRHQGGLVVEDRDGTLLLPHATTRVFTDLPPGALDGDHAPDAGRWTFVGGDGARWETGAIARSTPLARLCDATAVVNAEVRLGLARERLAAGETIDFGAAVATAHDLLVHGHPLMPWSEVTGIDLEAGGPLRLHTATKGDLVLVALEVADLAVLLSLVGDRR